MDSPSSADFFDEHASAMEGEGRRRKEPVLSVASRKNTDNFVKRSLTIR